MMHFNTNFMNDSIDEVIKKNPTQDVKIGIFPISANSRKTTSNTASYDNHEKINSGISFSFLYGFRLTALRAAGAPL